MSETHLSDIQGLIAMAFLTRLGGGGYVRAAGYMHIHSETQTHTYTESKGFSSCVQLVTKIF